MSLINDPLGKPTWPGIDPSIQEAVLNELIALKARPNADIAFGFNATMAALESHFSGGRKVESLFVTRHDISGLEATPIALASAAGRVRLVTLPRGSKQRLEGIFAAATFTDSEDLARLENFVATVGSAETAWSYIGVTHNKPRKAPKTAKQ